MSISHHNAFEGYLCISGSVVANTQVLARIRLDGSNGKAEDSGLKGPGFNPQS